VGARNRRGKSMRRRERGREKDRRWGEWETCMRVLLCFINPRVREIRI